MAKIKIHTFIELVLAAFILATSPVHSDELADIQALLQAGEYEKAFPGLKAYADAGHPGAMYMVCNYYDQGVVVKQNLKISFRYCQSAAELGHPMAIAHLATKYHTGSGVPQDKERAIELFHEAAELNDTGAMINLSHIYFYGDGAPKDTDKSFRFAMKAAELGSPTGAFNIGHFYLQGLEPGVHPDSPLNTAEAVRWLKIAADKGYSPAYAILGRVYTDPQLGLGDYEEAYFWLSLADKPGIEDVSALKYEAELKLNKARRNRVRQRLNEWSPTPSDVL